MRSICITTIVFIAVVVAMTIALAATPTTAASASPCHTPPEEPVFIQQIERSAKAAILEAIKPDKITAVALGADKGLSSAMQLLPRPATCTQSRVTASSFPIPSAKDLGLSKGGSPFYQSAYEGTTLDILPPALSFLNMPLVILVVQFQGLVRLVTLGPTAATATRHGNTAVSGAGAAAAQRIPDATPFERLLDLFASPLSVYAAWFRRPIAIEVRSTKTGELLSVGETANDAISVAVVPLPGGARNCDDYANGEVVLQHPDAPSCVRPDTTTFSTATGFVNAQIRWVRSIVFDTFVLGGDKKSNNGALAGGDSSASWGGAGAPAAASCVIDTTFHTQHSERLCVYTRCSGHRVCSEHSPKIIIHHWIEADFLPVIALVVVSLLARLIRPFASDSAIIRWAMCCAFGVLVMFTLFTLWLVNRFSDSPYGRVAILGAIGIGGTLAVTQGLVFWALSLLAGYMQQNHYIAAAVIISTIIATYLVHRMFGAAMPYVVYISCWVLQLSALTAAFLRNREFFLQLVWLYIVSRVVWWTVWKLFGVNLWPFGDIFGNDENDPKETFPAWVSKERGYVRPRAEWIPGRNFQERMDRYEIVGRQTTEVEMRKLRAHIRDNASRYIGRLTNANHVMRDAGVGQEDE